MSWNPVLRKSRNPSFRCWEILEMTPVAQESRNTLFHNSGFRRGIHGGNFCIGGGQRSHAKGSVKFWRRALPLTPVRLLREIPFTSLRYYESGTSASFRKILLGRETTHDARAFIHCQDLTRLNLVPFELVVSHNSISGMVTGEARLALSPFSFSTCFSF